MADLGLADNQPAAAAARGVFGCTPENVAAVAVTTGCLPALAVVVPKAVDAVAAPGVLGGAAPTVAAAGAMRVQAAGAGAPAWGGMPASLAAVRGLQSGIAEQAGGRAMSQRAVAGSGMNAAQEPPMADSDDDGILEIIELKREPGEGLGPQRPSGRRGRKRARQAANEAVSGEDVVGTGTMGGTLGTMGGTRTVAEGVGTGGAADGTGSTHVGTNEQQEGRQMPPLKKVPDGVLDAVEQVMKMMERLKVRSYIDWWSFCM